MQSVVHHLSRWDNAWKMEMDPMIEMTVVHSKATLIMEESDAQVSSTNGDGSETLLLGFADNESMFEQKETDNTQKAEGETFSSSKIVIDYDSESDSDGEESADDL